MAMRIIPILLGLLLALPAAATEEMAAARPLAVVEAPTLRLGDIFENAGPRAGQAIGAAPAPGRRFVLEVAQLAAIARAHGLSWRPLSAHERVVVERPGRAVPRDEITATLREALLQLGMEPDSELDLGPLLSPMAPPAALVQLSVESPGFDAASGRFSATLVLLAEGMPTLRQRVTGRALATVPVVLATRRMAVGEVVRPGDLRTARLRAERVRPGTAQQPAEVVGLQLRRPMAAEAAFLAADLAPPSLVERNALVVLVLEEPGLSLTAQGRALAAAPRGGLVPVMNLGSRAVVEGQVIGPGRVRIAMGATPVNR
jgi:flagella basal body P-ring formation protein FlgA